MLYGFRNPVRVVYLNRAPGGLPAQQPLVSNRSGDRKTFSDRVGITDV